MYAHHLPEDGRLWENAGQSVTHWGGPLTQLEERIQGSTSLSPEGENGSLFIGPPHGARTADPPTGEGGVFIQKQMGKNIQEPL